MTAPTLTLCAGLNRPYALRSGDRRIAEFDTPEQAAAYAAERTRTLDEAVRAFRRDNSHRWGCACIGCAMMIRWNFEDLSRAGAVGATAGRKEAYPVAAKDHRCAECGGTIPKGERHSYTSGKVEGELTTYRLCMMCHRLAQAYCSEINDEGWSMGTLREVLAEEGVTDLNAWLAASEEAEAERNRQTKRWRERSATMRDTVICDRCGATLATYADACRAALADPCPGFLAIERARAVGSAEVGRA